MTDRQTTDFNALDAIYPLPRENLFRQWAVSRNQAALPDVWPSYVLDGWHLAAHPDAQVCALQALDGSSLGWVIEPLLYLRPDGMERPLESLTLPIASRNVSDAELERALYGRDEAGHTDGTGFQGMWIAVLPAFARVYLGPIHSVVYDPEKRMVATSHNLLGAIERDLALSRAFDPLTTFGFYSFGLTAFRNVQRVLPNHYLDLNSFAPVRHWPKMPLQPLERGEAGAAGMVENGRRLLRGLAKGISHFVVPLSAGHDSRAILSTLRPFAEAGGGQGWSSSPHSAWISASGSMSRGHGAWRPSRDCRTRRDLGHGTRRCPFRR